ncbi:Erv1/Alr family protein [Medicago truncatula]|uniref:Sulfhydryl oxidase n=1 Tax=Medicago truncatula TaxID=3880 RepID=G7IAT9_MEDTR|nr:Erv1/Alr family protein [Medicago truncatula]
MSISFNLPFSPFQCRVHIVFSVSTPFNKACDFTLWLWSSHNKLNKRLSKEKAFLGTGDLKFPNSIWPTKQLCSSCYLVVVPAGAALAIAVASCAFGALAKENVELGIADTHTENHKHRTFEDVRFESIVSCSKGQCKALL